MAKKNDSVALLKPDTDMNSVMELVNEKLASLKRIEESVYKTSGVIDGFPTNIKNEMKIENLIRMWSSVKMRQAGYEAAAKDLKLDEYPAFTIDGSLPADIKSDIELKIDIINHKETLDKLNEFKKRAEQLMSEADKKAMLFADMKSFLQK